MTTVDLIARRVVEPEPGLGSSIGLLALGLVPSLVWAAVGIPLAIWNLTDPGQRASISPFSMGLLVAVVVANVAPFVLAGLALVRARRSHRLAWSRAVRAAATWAGIACVVSFALTAMATGGMA